ncbi:MAG: hypothetical protein Q4D29_07560 [Lachnospiraceae bacterium]|nr:hypothetical protein [Lachnospiraceae bacterium]
MHVIKKSTYMYICIFLIFIVGMGISSISNMVDFYVNDKADYNEWNADLGNKFETDLATTFYRKSQFINMNGAIRNILHQREMNGIVKLNNGYLMKPIEYVNDSTLQNYADSISKLKDYLNSRDIDLLYSITPYTVSKYDNQMPVGIKDYGNDNADRLISKIKAKRVDVIDFREVMYEDGINQYDMMYKTDHHWTTEAGFYAYKKLEEYIVNSTGCDVDNRVSDINSYTIKKYEKWHLGSNGQRTGRYYAGIDDFDFISPNFDIRVLSNEGRFGYAKDIIYNKKPLYTQDYSSRYTYDEVLGNSRGHYRNIDAKNDVKILMISDSFAKAVNPYLIMGFSEIYTICDEEIFSITTKFIDDYNPDVVVLLYYLNNAMDDDCYQLDFVNKTMQ